MPGGDVNFGGEAMGLAAVILEEGDFKSHFELRGKLDEYRILGLMGMRK
jgi:hypothetical protein